MFAFRPFLNSKWVRGHIVYYDMKRYPLPRQIWAASSLRYTKLIDRDCTKEVRDVRTVCAGGKRLSPPIRRARRLHSPSRLTSSRQRDPKIDYYAFKVKHLNSDSKVSGSGTGGAGAVVSAGAGAAAAAGASASSGGSAAAATDYGSRSAAPAPDPGPNSEGATH
ncbi:hypothetical protein EVAR_52190_1 [Eumeta japonica]|uniref:Uncharacterized protein n=1 Tax=Eumeta variegata TaxID=151549 RepID=A0A4C1YX88_EUMVA|nr:hypothetical protein EVAR_52190_1 [Eumeta japonica]